MAPLANDEIERRVTYHPPTDLAKIGHDEVRMVVRGALQRFEATLPDCREKSLAMTKLEESMMWANAAIARNHAMLPEDFG